MADQDIKNIIIVGGGTAGWLSAAHLAKTLKSNHPDGINVTLIESPDIPTIGVGEGTVPQMRESLQYLGLSETDFIRECNVTFKQSIKFEGWLHTASKGDGQNSYHHVFDYPSVSSLDLTPYWLLDKAKELSYVDAVTVQGKICDLGLGPKLITHKEFDGFTNYAYHLDAAKFSEFLTKHAVNNLGVDRRLTKVVDIMLHDDGSVKSVRTDSEGELEADFFVDCTGFSSLIMEKKLGVGFIDKSDVLFVDHALAAQVPYPKNDDAIPCATLSSAQEAGWIWDIGLSDRRGTGYVYSSKYSSHERAEEVFRNYLRPTIGALADELTCRSIKMKIGYREKFWHKNCVAIGLSQGFVEPLEATGLLIFDATARMLAEQFPAQKSSFPAVAERFNALVNNAWERVIDFVKLHYYLSERDDHSFWTDNRDKNSVPESLLKHLEIWKSGCPSAYDFPSRFEVFTKENYYYILYGMHFNTDIKRIKYRYQNSEKAEKEFQYIQKLTVELSGTLIKHRDLIERIKAYGLQKL